MVGAWEDMHDGSTTLLYTILSRRTIGHVWKPNTWTGQTEVLELKAANTKIRRKAERFEDFITSYHEFYVPFRNPVLTDSALIPPLSKNLSRICMYIILIILHSTSAHQLLVLFIIS